jgi:hypothetical protein
MGGGGITIGQITIDRSNADHLVMRIWPPDRIWSACCSVVAADIGVVITRGEADKYSRFNCRKNIGHERMVFWKNV